MSEHTYLFKASVNKILDIIANLPEGNNIAPNDIELTKMINVSRSTVRSCVDHLIAKNLIVRDGAKKRVVRKTEDDDYFELTEGTGSKDEQFEKFFLNLIHTGKLLPGDKFSELSLAKKSGCTTITVREFLIKFSNNGLIEKIPRGQWRMVKFDEDFARELISFREMVEMKALSELLKLPASDGIWQELETLLFKHQEVRNDMNNRFEEFPDLDRELHLLIQRNLKNRFTRHFFDIVSFICHYHYQWDKTGELERFLVAIDEHIDLLNNLVTKNTAGAVLSLQKHLESAEITLLRCVHGLES